MTTQAPRVDEAYLSNLFSELCSMEVQLDDDPLKYGPKRLNAKVAQCRRHLTRCEQLFLQVSQILHNLRRELRRIQTDFDLQVTHMLANDPVVMAGPNLRDREAFAKNRLQDEAREIHELDSAVQDLDSVMSVIKAKRADLKDMQGRIRDQIKLCQEEVGLGSRWGSARSHDEPAVDLSRYAGMEPKAVVRARELGISSIGDLHIGEAPDEDEDELDEIRPPVEEEVSLESIMADVIAETAALAAAAPDEIEEEPEPVVVEPVVEEEADEEVVLAPATQPVVDFVEGVSDTVIDDFLDDLDVSSEAVPTPPQAVVADNAVSEMDFDSLLDIFG